VCGGCSLEYLQEFQGGLSDRLAEASDTGWQYRDGGFELPDRPGIGVEINEALLEPFIVKTSPVTGFGY
jgi:L-alanine-DL-glutamate epimerase-like enolase superfamily enzyme